MKQYVLMILLSWMSMNGSAQFLYTIKGHITDCRTGEELPFTTITALDGKVGVLSDLDGNYKLQLSEQVNYIKVNYIGYAVKEIPVGEMKSGEILQLDICLEEVWRDIIDPFRYSEVLIEGLRTNKPILAIPASIGSVGMKQLHAGDQTSLQNALNTIPGVVMEQRGYGGSHRISIRGSAFRSPFAVRNIKMYMDGIPLTSPDGQAPLDMIDASEVGSVEIIKGPAGSIWGSGNGGVLHFHASREYLNIRRFSSSVQFGSYDLWRTVNKLEWGNRTNGFSLSHIYQDNPGYRQQEYNHKNQVVFNGHYVSGSRNRFIIYGNYFDGRWALPGGLNALQADTMPEQASAYSWMNNAHVARQRLTAGVSHQYTLNNTTSVRTAAYGYFTDKTNPFGTSAFSNGYKIEGANGAGVRSDWNKLIRLGRANNLDHVQLAWGGEYQYERYEITESSLLNGQPDDFRYKYNVDYHSAMFFFSSDFAWNEKLVMNAGLSANKVLQIVDGNTSSGFNYDTTATWNWAILPRIALDWQLKRNWFAYLAASSGNANPTIFEMVDYENNSFNLDLHPERGLNLEVGFKAKHPENKWSAECNAYRFYLSNAIVSYQDTSAGFGNEFFRYTNAGKTVQQGIEWSFTRNLTRHAESQAGRVMATFIHSGSVYHYEFDNFFIEDSQFNGVQFAGNKMPGIPLMTISNLASIWWMDKLHVDVQHQWFDRVPLNNQNDHWAGAYNLINTKIMWRGVVLKKLAWTAYAGINNAFNARYTSFYNLNNEFNRFYNPSPPRNYFGGLSLSWIFADLRVIIFPD